MKKSIFILVLAIGSIFCLDSCKKLLEVDTPQHQLVTSTVFSDSTTATAALLNIYARFNTTIDGAYNLNLALYSDELSYSNSAIQVTEFLNGKVSPDNTSDLNIWKNYYFIIYSCNDIIGQLKSADHLSTTLKKHLAGEASFLRAWSYFYLTNAYGRVPLALETSQTVTAKSSNSEVSEIYIQINKDLAAAKQDLPDQQDGLKIRANKFAAIALEAKVFLYQKEWQKAETASSLVIGSGRYGPLPAPAAAFSAGSTETILEFQSQNGFNATGPQYLPRSGKPQYFLSTKLVNSFEPGDQRFSSWTKLSRVSNVNYYLVYKYHNRAQNTDAPENLIALRAGEQYLIRAEARANLNNISGARDDLNIIRVRAGLSPSTVSDATGLLQAISHERQVELFTEWGNRFLDLKRTGQADSIFAMPNTITGSIGVFGMMFNTQAFFNQKLGVTFDGEKNAKKICGGS